MERGHKGVAIVPILVIVLVIGIIGYFIYQNFNNITNNTPLETTNENTTVESVIKLPTPELINKDFIDGKISKGEQMLYMAYAFRYYEKLPEKYQSNTGWDGTLYLSALNEDVDNKIIVCSIKQNIRTVLLEVMNKSISCP